MLFDSVIPTSGDAGQPAEAANLPPYYVYVLADCIDDAMPETFYVGKGQGDRIGEHWAEIQRQPIAGEGFDEKQHRLDRIRQSGRTPVQRIVGRFATEAEALAVEAVLIKFVFGLDALTNAIHGHGADLVRAKGNWEEIAGLDHRREPNTHDGIYGSIHRQKLTDADAYGLRDQIRDGLVAAGFAPAGFSGASAYDPGESNGRLALLVPAGGLDLIVQVTASWLVSICVATTQATRLRAAELETRGLMSLPVNTIVAGMPRYRNFVPPLKRASDDAVPAAIVAWVVDQVRLIAAIV